MQAEELQPLLESQDDIVVVDTHPTAVYEREHIAGAANLPWVMHIKGPINLPCHKLLILYCACVQEATAEEVANQLTKKFGYRNIKLLEGGCFRWMELGYPTEQK